MKIGEIIKAQRIRKGFTQEELAAKIDVSVRTIQRIEKGEVDPRTYTIHAISEVLELEYDKLISAELNIISYTDKKLWLALLHLSGMFILLFPPLIIWWKKKDIIEDIGSHAIAVINFQLSMLIYLIPSGMLVLVLIGLPIVIFLGLFSTIVIIINSIRVINDQPYKYPLSISFLK